MMKAEHSLLNTSNTQEKDRSGPSDGKLATLTPLRQAEGALGPWHFTSTFGSESGTKGS